MTKWGKVFFYGTLIWQIPCIWWLFHYSKPNENILLGLPESVTTFTLMYLFYSIVFGAYITYKYVGDPTGKGVSIDTVKKAGEQ